MMQGFIDFVSLLHDLQIIPLLHYDFCFFPVLVRMNVTSFNPVYPLDFCRPCPFFYTWYEMCSCLLQGLIVLHGSKAWKTHQ